MDFESVRRGKIQKWCYLWCDLAAAKLEDERDACYYTNVAGKDEPATAILDSKLQAIKSPPEWAVTSGVAITRSCVLTNQGQRAQGRTERG